MRRQAWRDSPGHTNTHLRDFQVIPYVPHSATVEEFGYRAEVQLRADRWP